MSSYYSSDDDIAWGPLTLREIKQMLKRPQVRKVTHSRRLTMHPTVHATQTPKFRSGQKPEDIQEHVASLAEDLQYKCNTSTETEYFTANESIQKQAVAGGKHLDDTQFKFVNAAKNRQSEADIENFHQTLIDISVVPESSESSNAEYTDESMNSSTGSINGRPQRDTLQKEDDIIILSSDDEVVCDLAGDKSDQNPIIGKCEYEENSNCAENHSTLNPMETEPQQLDQSDTSVGIPQCPKISSPIEVPYIDFAAFEDSDEECPQLNNTLEEIERMLGSNASGSQNSSSDESITPKMFFSPKDIISGSSFSQSPSCSFSNDGRKIPSRPNSQTKSLIPKKLKSPKDIKVCGVKTVKVCAGEVAGQKPKTPVVDCFRIPKTPIRPKSTINGKSIISPVGLYIKYSPQAVLTKNVKSSVLKKIETSPRTQKSQSKENLPKFPEIIYKPSRKQITTDEDHIVLPSSIEKMMKETHLVKHEKRVLAEVDNNEIREKLLTETELTRSSISDSLLSESNPDVSVWTNKQVFK